MAGKAIPWRPSNGTGGDIFRADWCDKCHREQGNRKCKIFTKTLIYDINDPEYPKEWIDDDDGPRCTAFEKPHNTRHRTIKDKRQVALDIPA